MKKVFVIIITLAAANAVSAQGKAILQDFHAAPQSRSAPAISEVVITKGNAVPANTWAGNIVLSPVTLSDGENQVPVTAAKAVLYMRKSGVDFTAVSCKDQAGKSVTLNKVGAGTLQFCSADKSMQITMTKIPGGDNFSIKIEYKPASDGRSYVTGY